MRPESSPTRRQFLESTAAGAAGLLFSGTGRAESTTPVRVITRGPKYHWFGYYDKLETSPTDRYVLGMEVDFQHRSPRADDQITVGMVDLQANDEWVPLGTSTAWCWQQGCMLQWRPGSPTEVLWNDRQGDDYVCHVFDTKTGAKRTVPAAIYSASPNGKEAVTVDFRRLGEMRPGYGYNGVPDPYAEETAPSETGIFRVDLEKGDVDLIVPFPEVLKVGKRNVVTEPGIKHWFNHLLFSPDGSRFIFLHRWKYPNGRWKTRMLTANPDGSGLRVVDDNGLTSHFIWGDPDHILAWSDHPPHGPAFYLFDEKTGDTQVVGPEVMTRDGHCTYLPNRDWIVNDTYPDRDRMQHVYLYHVPTGRRVPVASFHLPTEYKGEWRCDTHPRHTRDGNHLIVDAPVADGGRQLHLVDIRGLVG